MTTEVSFHGVTGVAVSYTDFTEPEFTVCTLRVTARSETTDVKFFLPHKCRLEFSETQENKTGQIDAPEQSADTPTQ